MTLQVIRNDCTCPKMPHMSNSPPALVLSGLLREMRNGHGISQLELSMRLGVSQRHVSYLELGRARPSRSLLLAWMDEVQAPVSLRNAALLHGGFAGQEEDTGAALDDAGALQMARTLLAAHAPNPAICINADWQLLLANPGRIHFNRLVTPGLPAQVQAATEGVDMIDILVRPGGMLHTVRGAAYVGWSLLHQLRAEAWANQALRARVDAYEAQLQALHPCPNPTSVRRPDATQFRMVFDTAQGTLSFQAVQIMMGLPQNVILASPRVTLWYPTDAHTSDVMARATTSQVVDGGAASHLP